MVEITPEEFWKNRHTYKEWSSGSPVVGDFVEAFREAGKETGNIACTMVSKVMSVTYGVALLAKKMVQEENPGLNINIVDSKTAVGALGFIVLESARAADAGAGLAEVTGVMEDMVSRVSWVTGLQTTTTQKFGRIPREAFNEFNNQTITVIASLRGAGTVESNGIVHSKPECFARMLEVVERNIGPGKPLHANVQYTDNIEDGRTLFTLVKQRFNCAEAFFTPYNALAGATSGPCTSISFFT